MHGADVVVTASAATCTVFKRVHTTNDRTLTQGQGQALIVAFSRPSCIRYSGTGLPSRRHTTRGGARPLGGAHIVEMPPTSLRLPGSLQAASRYANFPSTSVRPLRTNSQRLLPVIRRQFWLKRPILTSAVTRASATPGGEDTRTRYTVAGEASQSTSVMAKAYPNYCSRLRFLVLTLASAINPSENEQRAKHWHNASA